MADDDRLRELEEKYEGYKVYDNAGEKIGKVDDLFVDEQDREEYIGVKMGFFGLRSTLIPMDVARVNERDRSIEVADSRDHVKEAPHFADDDDITPEFERRIRSHFGLEGEESSSDRGSYGRRSASGAEGAAMGDNTTRGETREANEMYDDRELDVEGSPASSREPAGREEYRNREDYGGSASTGTAATGGMSDLETGERDRDEDTQTGGSPTDEAYRAAYREAYREGFRAGQREGAGGGAGGEDQGASRYSGASSEGSGAQEFGDTEAYRSGSTGGQPSRGETLDRGSSERDYEQGGEDREGTRRSDEGGSEESGATRVWRRIRG